VLVHVVDGVPPGSDESLSARQRQAGAERVLNEIARDIGEGTEKRIMLGNRADALAQVAAEEGADLVVIGSKPAGFGSRKLRSTLARELEAATPIPVVVAPPTTRKRTEQRLTVATGAAMR
jgi:nucleotide-binding universal stress UspA family protein